ncbi:hypothetical protein [uncultured Enterococcus sp.]|uniref:hypothetical protein n=1 Tax=uncultured Enterococcus sp. TaxID=167972 RepID=UPI002AA631F2|nr:hypothetical protein [uncultured Enterococcus sp.]
MKTKTIAAVVGAVICLGAASQVVESSINKEGLKEYLTENFEEQDEKDSPIDFEIGDKEERSFLEWVGF